MSTNRRTPGVYSSPAPKDEQGNRLCRNCRGPLPKGKRHNCSRECSEEWMARTSPAYMRMVLFKRDKGVCALCGVDTVRLQQEFEDLRKTLKYQPQWNAKKDEFLKAHGIPASRAVGDWWDADHIVPVVEGGGECGSAGFRTLCIPCHQKVTKELHGRLAAGRRQRRAEEKDAERGLLVDL